MAKVKYPCSQWAGTVGEPPKEAACQRCLLAPICDKAGFVPTCRHCGKPLLPVVTTSFVSLLGHRTVRPRDLVGYFCPDCKISWAYSRGYQPLCSECGGRLKLLFASREYITLPNGPNVAQAGIEGLQCTDCGERYSV